MTVRAFNQQGRETMRAFAILALTTLAACSTPADPDDWERVVGWANPLMSSIQAIELPAQVVANQPFNVTIRTLGSSSCTRADGAEAAVDRSVALVTPYDRVAPPNTGCTRDMRAFPRTVSVTFASPGPATIRLNTRTPEGVTSSFEWNIDVRPQ